MKNWQSIFVLGALLICSLTSCQTAYNPVTGQLESTVMSREEEMKLGAKHYPRMIQSSFGKLEDDQLQSYVQSLGHQLAKVSHDPFMDYEFSVVNSSAPNAWALPGGKISVTRGLLMEIQNEDELAAVIGHEITHATARHAARQQTRTLSTSLLLTTGQLLLQTQMNDGGDNTLESMLLMGSRFGAMAYLQSYSREHEREADLHGMEYMARAGYDPEGMVHLHQTFKSLKKRKPTMVEQWFSSHPSSSERIQNARNRVPELQQQFDIPTHRQLNQFESRVARVWHPRKKAYEQMDRGKTLMEKENTQQAAKAFSKAIQQYSGEALFHMWLGVAQSKQQHHQKAQQAIKKALNMRPNLFHIQLSAGLVYYRGDAHRQSIRHLNRAEDILPAQPLLDYYRARNHEQLGNRSEAIQYYRSFLKHVSSGKKAKYALQKLQQWDVIPGQQSGK